MKLYELSDAYRTLSERLEADADNETDDKDQASHDQAQASTLRAALDSIEDAIEVKATSIMVMHKEWLGEAEVLKKEEARLERRRKALENRAKSIKDYLLTQLLVANLSKLKTRLFSFSVSPAKKSVIVDNVELLPPEFIKMTKEPKKNDIKAAIEAGTIVPGAHLESGDKSLAVK